MDSAQVIEGVIAEGLKPAGYRKRARNWHRVSGAGVYQVVNLQRSSWGGGSCYLNLGWDPSVGGKAFQSEHQCLARIRAEQTGVIPAIALTRSSGEALEVPGINLLDSGVAEHFSEDEFRRQVRQTVVEPVAAFMESTQHMQDLVPLFTRHPGWATLHLRDYMRTLGAELPRL